MLFLGSYFKRRPSARWRGLWADDQGEKSGSREETGGVQRSAPQLISNADRSPNFFAPESRRFFLSRWRDLFLPNSAPSPARAAVSVQRQRRVVAPLFVCKDNPEIRAIIQTPPARAFPFPSPA